MPVQKNPEVAEILQTGFLSVAEMLGKMTEKADAAYHILENVDKKISDVSQAFQKPIDVNFVQPSIKTPKTAAAVSDYSFVDRIVNIVNIGFNTVNESIKITGDRIASSIDTLYSLLGERLSGKSAAVSGSVNNITTTNNYALSFGDVKGVDKFEAFSSMFTDKFVTNFAKFVESAQKYEKTDAKKLEDISNALKGMTPEKEKPVKNFKMHPMFQIGAGVAMIAASMMLLAFVDMVSFLKGVLLLGMLVATSKLLDGKNYGQGFIHLAAGIGILTLSLIAMSFVEWESLFKMTAFLLMTGVAMRAFDFDDKRSKNPMVIFASAMGLLTLSLIAMSIVDWKAAIVLVGFVTALGLVMRFTKLGESGIKNPMIPFSFGVAVTVLALNALEEIDFSNAAKLVGFVAMFGIAAKIIKPKDIFGILALSAGSIALAFAFSIIASVNMEWETFGKFAATIGLIGGAMAVFGIPVVAALVVAGSVALLTAAVAAGSIAVSMMLIQKANIDEYSMQQFATSSRLLMRTLAEIMPDAILALPAATAMIPVAASALVTALSMAAIGALNYNTENIAVFGTAAALTVKAFTDISILDVTEAAAKSLLMLPVFASVFAGGLTLGLISNLKYNTETLQRYTESVNIIVGGMNSFGVIDLTKAAAKAVLLLPVFVTSLAAAGTLKAITELDVPQSKISTFGETVDQFVTAISTTVNNNADRLSGMQGGLEAMAKLIGVGSGLADIVTSFANMSYNVYEAKDGKLVLTGTKKITDDEIAAVGTNVGKLIQGLMKPLAVISSDEKVWDFGGGVKVDNPFSGGWFGTDNDSGINRLEKIGGAFLPISQAVKNLTESATGEVDPSTLVKNFIDFVGQFAKMEIDPAAIDPKTESLDKFVSVLADTDRWSAINSNIKGAADGFKDIVANINKLDMNKATKTEALLKLAAETKSSENLQKVLERLCELIDKMDEPRGGTSTQTIVQKVEQAKETSSEKLKPIMDDIKDLLSDIAATSAESAEKLGGKLKTVMIQTDRNSSTI